MICDGICEALSRADLRGGAAVAATRSVQGPVLVFPTGTGKTVVFALLVPQCCGRVLILAHRDARIYQAVGKLQLVAPALAIGVV
jgi:superfamily II DNA or RNA helicase